MKRKISWFTLVELIVVITILAILGTIAFISLQGYSLDARNSKRVNDLGSISTAMSIKITQWVGLIAFIAPDINAQIPNVSIAWSYGNTGWSNPDYNAWKVNYTALGIKREDFQDPTGSQDYAMGATTKINGKYQLATKLEEDWWASVAKIIGDYNPRSSLLDTKNIVTLTSTGTIVSIGTSDIGKLKEWDTIWTTRGNSPGSTIAKVSADGKQLTLTSAATSTGSLTIAIAESPWLIDAGWSTNGIVVTDWANYFPY